MTRSLTNFWLALPLLKVAPCPTSKRCCSPREVQRRRLGIILSLNSLAKLTPAFRSPPDQAHLFWNMELDNDYRYVLISMYVEHFATIALCCTYLFHWSMKKKKAHIPYSTQCCNKTTLINIHDNFFTCLQFMSWHLKVKKYLFKVYCYFKKTLLAKDSAVDKSLLSKTEEQNSDIWSPDIRVLFFR